MKRSKMTYFHLSFVLCVLELVINHLNVQSVRLYIARGACFQKIIQIFNNTLATKMWILRADFFVKNRIENFRKT